MFKIFLCTVAVVVAVCGLANADNIDKDAQVLSFKNDPADAEGTYAYAYETSNGIQQQEAGNVAGASGAFNYVSPEGEQISLQYVADENGFQPSGSHLPTPPPIPEAILRGLEYIRTHPQQEQRRR